MNVEQVIKLGEEISVNFSMFDFGKYWIPWTIIAALAVIQVLIFKFKNEEKTEVSITPIALIAIMLCGFFLVDSVLNSVKEEELIEKWKQEVAYPYIKSLPEEQHEIVYLKIDPELSHDVRSNLFYTYSEEVRRTPLTFSFKGNGVETYTNWIEAHMKLSEQSKPYVSFKRLTTELGHNINPGYYDVKIHLPESYEFTDIK